MKLQTLHFPNYNKFAFSCAKNAAFDKSGFGNKSELVLCKPASFTNVKMVTSLIEYEYYMVVII